MKILVFCLFYAGLSWMATKLWMTKLIDKRAEDLGRDPKYHSFESGRNAICDVQEAFRGSKKDGGFVFYLIGLIIGISLLGLIVLSWPIVMPIMLYMTEKKDVSKISEFFGL